MKITTSTPYTSLSKHTSRAIALLSLAGALWPASASAGGAHGDGAEGYSLGDEIPISCLNRTL